MRLCILLWLLSRIQDLKFKNSLPTHFSYPRHYIFIPTTEKYSNDFEVTAVVDRLEEQLQEFCPGRVFYFFDFILP